MNRRRCAIRIAVVGMVLALLAAVAPVAAANGPIVVEATEPYGTYGGIEYVRYSGRFQGLASGAYDVPFEIVAPADVSRGNGVVVIEPYHVMGTGGRDGYLTPEFLFGRRFSFAAVGWYGPGVNPMEGFDAGEAIEILASFATALREDDVARSLVGDVHSLYGLGGSLTTRPLLVFLDSESAPLLDYTMLVVPRQVRADFAPNPDANKIMAFLTESDLVWSAHMDYHTEVLRGSAANYREYEVAGGQHAPDTPWIRAVFGAWGIEMEGSNPLDWTPLVRGLFVAGHRWAQWGIRPPPSAALDAAPAGATDPVYQAEYGLALETGIARDENGNALGGIRMPDLALGRGQYVAYDPASAWGLGLLGTWQDLKCTPLPGGGVRFPSHRRYVRAVSRQATRLVLRGLLLPLDSMRIVADASASDVGRPGACLP